jgi:arylsulfatase A-like enzyme
MRSGDFSSGRARAYLEMCERFDSLLRALRELMPSANIIVVSDHGVGIGYRLKQRVVQHFLACPGTILANGPDVRAGAGAGVEAIDFVPTLLSYFGLPLGEDLAGEPVPDLLAPAATRPERIPSWRRYVRNSRVPLAAEAEAIGQREQLRGLGYID